MSIGTRTATIQVRVVPVVKKASEEVLWRIGLTMSEAVELFLRRVIVDERIPFDLIALEAAQVGLVLTGERRASYEGRSRARSETRATRKKLRTF